MRRGNTKLTFFAGVIALIVLIPVIVVLVKLSGVLIYGNEDVDYIVKNLIPSYLKDSAILVVGVIILTAIFGIISAYLVSFHNFFLSKFFNIALILPLAIPAYISGFIYVNIFDFDGIIVDLFGFTIDILNIYGAIFILSLCLYPYVYFFAKNSFSNNMGNILDVAYSLGASNTRAFFKITLPYNRIAITGSLFLVIMETLSDYGLVAYFGVNSFSAGIFKLFLSFNNEIGAMALSGVLLAFIFGLILLEDYERKNKTYVQTSFKVTKKTKLKGIKNILAFLFCFTLLGFAFLIPITWLIYWAIKVAPDYLSSKEFIVATINSFSIAGISSFVIVVVAFFLSFVARMNKNKSSKVILKLTTLGYAMPGTIIALGILLFFGILNKKLVELNLPLVFTGGFVVIIIAYLIRFLATALYPIQGAYSKIKNNIDLTSIVLKRNSFILFFKIHTPLLSSTLLLGIVVALIDVLKELPITMLLGPFNFTTLSVMAYGYAGNEQIYEASLPSLLIVGLSLIPTLVMHYLKK